MGGSLRAALPVMQQGEERRRTLLGDAEPPVLDPSANVAAAGAAAARTRKRARGSGRAGTLLGDLAPPTTVAPTLLGGGY